MYDVVRSLSHLLISCLSYTKVYNRYLKGSHLSGALDGRDVSNWRLHPKALLICIAVALRSCCSSNLCAPHTNLFWFPAHSVRNSLPSSIRSSHTVNSFRKRLKPILFQSAFNNAQRLTQRL